ncbi:hypothetical protein A1351_23405 [Methylosinus sp. R-45379]|nr:hypothetical protein A1351_23405 [Methylosinus sp. R-45379]
METRSAKETADWLARWPEIEIVSRDRCGIYAQGIRQGAPKARQFADRFHLLQNLRVGWHIIPTESRLCVGCGHQGPADRRRG